MLVNYFILRLTLSAVAPSISIFAYGVYCLHVVCQRRSIHLHDGSIRVKALGNWVFWNTISLFYLAICLAVKSFKLGICHCLSWSKLHSAKYHEEYCTGEISSGLWKWWTSHYHVLERGYYNCQPDASCRLPERRKTHCYRDPEALGEACRKYINHGAHSFYSAHVSSPTSPWVTKLYTQTLSLLHSMPSRCRPSRSDPAIISHTPLTASSGPVMYFHVFALLSLPAWDSQIIDDAWVNHPSLSFVHQVPQPSRGLLYWESMALLGHWSP